MSEPVSKPPAPSVMATAVAPKPDNDELIVIEPWSVKFGTGVGAKTPCSV